MCKYVFTAIIHQKVVVAISFDICHIAIELTKIEQVSIIHDGNQSIKGKPKNCHQALTALHEDIF